MWTTFNLCDCDRCRGISHSFTDDLKGNICESLWLLERIFQIQVHQSFQWCTCNGFHLLHKCWIFHFLMHAHINVHLVFIDRIFLVHFPLENCVYFSPNDRNTYIICVMNVFFVHQISFTSAYCIGLLCWIASSLTCLLRVFSVFPSICDCFLSLFLFSFYFLQIQAHTYTHTERDIERY